MKVSDSLALAMLGAIACGESAAPRAETPAAPRAQTSELRRDSTPESPRQRFASPPDPAHSASDPRGHPHTPPARTPPEQESVSELPISQEPFPEPGDGISLREAYRQTEAEMASLSNLLDRKNREVLARFGRNDTPEGLRILTPIRDRLQRARRHLDHLTCRDRPVGNVRQELEKRSIPLDGFRVDSRWLQAYVAAKIVDGDISAARAEDLRFVLSKSGHGVMNPSSRGAHTINQRIVQALDCFGLSGPPRARMRLPLEPPPPPRPSISRFRYFSTCGDAVCQTYRGPTPGVPRCRHEREGAACSQSGATCDLANNCNMHLVCTDTDPARQCPR